MGVQGDGKDHTIRQLPDSGNVPGATAPHGLQEDW
jgi:hypothetical protein